MKAVIYARYSSERQTEKSIEDQVKACQEYAERADLDVIKIYADRAKSGKTDNRPEFQQMIKDSAKREFNIVLCWKFDRIGRNAGDYYINERKLMDHGVKIESITEHIPDGPVAPILKGVYVGQAESYNIGLAINVLRGMESNAQEAKVNGAITPFGLRVSKDRHYELDPETAPFVKNIFELFVIDGYSYAEIANFINEHGIKTNRGKPFTGFYVKRILQNIRYKGTYKFKDIVIENGIPAIVDPETFDKAQALIERNRQGYIQKRKAEKYMLLGKLYCGECGSVMTADAGTSKTGRLYRYYACKKRKTDKSACSVKPIRKDVLDDFIVQVTKEYVLQDEIIEKIADYAMALQEQSDDRAYIRKLDKDIAENQKQIDNLMKLLMDGWASDEIKSKLGVLEEEKKSLKKALSIAELNLSEIDRDGLIWTLKKFKEIESSEDPLAKEMIQSLVNSVVVDNKKITIVYNYGEYKNDTETYLLKILQCSANSQMVNLQLKKLNFYPDWFSITLQRPAA